VAGFSVTIPHKQRILRYLDVIDPAARRIGAVNTVWRKAGKWRGTNTDADGVTAPLGRHVRIGKSSVLVVGNGGAARGAAFALAAAGAKLAITGRNLDRVRALAKACDAEPLSREQTESRMFDVLIHATPLGMAGRAEQCFFDDHIPAKLVFDMVYNPLETALILESEGPGRRGDPRPGDVPRTGRAAVRNLDRRERAARGDAEGRARRACAGSGYGRLIRIMAT